MGTEKKPVRIKGVNSEYRWDRGGIVEVDPKEDLYLRIFICPNYMPSEIEEPLDDTDKRCVGTDQDCPAPKDKNLNTGHAMIQLNQKNGIELSVGNGNKLIIGQDTESEIPDSLSFMRMIEGVSVSHIKVTTTGEIHLKSSNGLGIKILNDCIQVSKSDAASDTPIVKITEESIELFQEITTKTVKIHGNLTVNGNITYTGTCTDSKP